MGFLIKVIKGYLYFYLQAVKAAKQSFAKVATARGIKYFAYLFEEYALLDQLFFLFLLKFYCSFFSESTSFANAVEKAAAAKPNSSAKVTFSCLQNCCCNFYLYFFD